MVKKANIPPLAEFIDLSERPRSRSSTSYNALRTGATVAVYENSSNDTQTLNVRLSDEVADKYGLIEGMKMVCLVHPDADVIALKYGKKGKGAALFRPRNGRSIVFQTTLRGNTLEPQHAKPATVSKVGSDTLVLSITEG